MPTFKKRLNLTLSSEVDASLSRLAEKENLLPSTLAYMILQEGLELREDQYFNEVVKRREAEKGVHYIPHKNVWE